MKKLILILLASAGVSSVASAQTGFGWGVKGGLNITGITNSSGGTSKTGFTVGAFADYRFTRKFAVSADVLYSRQGVADHFEMDGVKAKSRLNYLNIPILANYYIIGNLAVKAGIQPGFLLSANNITKHDGNTDKRKVSSIFHGADFAIPIGVSYEFPLGIIAEARYNIGVSNIFTADATARNSVFALTVGYRF